MSLIALNDYAGAGTSIQLSTAKVCSPRVDRFALLVMAAAVLPAMACLFVGAPSLAGRWLFAALLPWLGLLVLLQDARRYLILTLGCMPAIMLLRDFLFYNVPIVLFFTGLALACFTAPRAFNRMARLMWPWFALGGLYWLASFYHTGQYQANLRVFELLMAAAGIFVLAARPQDLGAALLGVCATTVSMGVAFLPHGERLGKATVNGFHLGNPTSLGVPLALIFLLLFVERGRRLRLEHRPLLRLSMLAAVSGLLLLSTSRASWAVVALCIGALLVKRETKHRLLLAGALLVLVGVGIAILSRTERGQYLTKAIDNTFSSASSLQKKTTGRSAQWALFLHIFPQSPIWGFGPGDGGAVYAHFSERYGGSGYQEGKNVAWHSLFLHVGVETGGLGLLALAALFLPLWARSRRRWRAYRDPMPFLAVLGLLTIAMTVSAMDAMSGLYLGIALTCYRPWEASAVTLPRTGRGEIRT